MVRKKNNKKTSAKRNLRLLIVEDEGIIAKDLQNRLENLEYSVLAITASGEEAIEKTKELRPDLVLMDIKLPGEIDGIEAAKKIYKSLNIPVIYITAYADEETLSRAKETEPYGYILKPFEDRELCANIETGIFKYKMELKLKESEEKYRDLFENANDLIQRADKNGKFIDVNKKWRELLEYKKEEVKKLTLWGILRKDQILYCRQLFERILSGEAVSGIETVFISKTGKEIFVEGNANAQFKNGKFIATRGIFRDISERKGIEEELKKKILELEKFNKITMGREMRILELKDEVARLKGEKKPETEIKSPSGPQTLKGKRQNAKLQSKIKK